MKHKVKRIHFVGIGGAGMSGIAEVLRQPGLPGQRLRPRARTRRRGASRQPGRADRRSATPRRNVAGADAVVVSTRGDGRQPGSGRGARAGDIPVVPRALMLAELMRLKQGIAIAGTHGKTTTTSLVASVLAEGGLDPTFVIGGRLDAAGANARLGTGEFIVVEADESDASFLYLQPVIAVVTNIDADHMETYGHDFAQLKQAFVDFLQRLPFYGVAVLCVDDAERARDHAARSPSPIVTYGFGEDARSARRPTCARRGGRMRFRARARRRARAAPIDVELNLPGVHNVLNALAAIAVGTRSRRRRRGDREGAGRIHAASAGASSATATCALAGRRQLHAGRRLRPPPGRDGGDARGGARRFPGPAAGARVPAAPLHAHARLLRGFREGAVDRRRAGAGRGLSRGRGADRRRRRPRAGARGARRRARSSRCSSRTSPTCRRRSARVARDGDVVVTMGAGSIGSVAGACWQRASVSDAMNMARRIDIPRRCAASCARDEPMARAHELARRRPRATRSTCRPTSTTSRAFLRAAAAATSRCCSSAWAATCWCATAACAAR